MAVSGSTLHCAMLCVLPTYVCESPTGEAVTTMAHQSSIYIVTQHREKKVEIIRHQLLMCVLLMLLECMTTTRTMMIMMSLLLLYMDKCAYESVCANKMLCNTYRLSFFFFFFILGTIETATATIAILYAPSGSML